MVLSDAEYELRKFLKATDNFEVIHLVLSGSVISGKLSSYDPEETTVQLDEATIYSGLQSVTVETIFIPIRKILAWGYGDISKNGP